MKNEFWTHQLEILFFWPFSTIFSLACLLVGIIMTIEEASIYWPLLAMGIFLLIICICAIFFQKKTLCKVVFSKEQIIVKRLGKIITTIKWPEITKVKGYLYGNKGGRYMSFISQNEHIDVVPTQKMYKAIMAICPYDSIKMMIDDIDEFKYLHKNKKEG